MSTQPKKFIPCGGPAGFDVTSTPKALVSVKVWSEDSDRPGFGVINGIYFTYKNDEEQVVSVGPLGSTIGTHHMIDVGDDEHVSVSGTTDGKHVTSLTFFKAAKQYGPYGAQSKAGFGTFSFPPSVVGFFGTYSDKLVAIGAYVIHGILA